jgi:hypothetical protein
MIAVMTETIANTTEQQGWQGVAVWAARLTILPRYFICYKCYLSSKADYIDLMCKKLICKKLLWYDCCNDGNNWAARLTVFRLQMLSEQQGWLYSYIDLI